MKRKKAIRLLVIVICLYLVFTSLQGTIGLLTSGEKVTRREGRLARLMKERDELRKKEKSVETKEFLERIAYDELGLSRPGEKVFIIPREMLADNTPKAVIDNTPNWKKWVELLF